MTEEQKDLLKKRSVAYRFVRFWCYALGYDILKDRNVSNLEAIQLLREAYLKVVRAGIRRGFVDREDVEPTLMASSFPEHPTTFLH